MMKRARWASDAEYRAHWRACAAMALFARAHGQSFQKDQKRDVQNAKTECERGMLVKINELKGTNDEAM